MAVGKPVSVPLSLSDETVGAGFEAGPHEARTPTADSKAREKRYPLCADENMMSLVGLGDAAAFTVLYDRHGRAAYSLAYRMMGEKQAAEDLTQEAFIKVWRSAGGYRAGRGSVRTWILSIVHNRGIDQLRSLASRRRTQDKIEASAPKSQPSEAFAESWRNSQREQVREALKTLPKEQLEILELAYFSGYTHVEIAELLDVPLGTVKGRMRLGLKKIRDYFDSQGMAVPT
ncbi:MAG: sigma-70 family RNA polymerase sigma factor [Actinomycetota bacterium]|nr:sigma-70 family RNA polymerase sigma factor [Actinomycetota bacterium]